MVALPVKSGLSRHESRVSGDEGVFMVTIVAVCLFAYFYNYCKYLQLTAVHFSIFARKTVVYCRGVLVKEFFKAFRISELVLEAFRIKLPLDPRLI